MVEAVRGNPTSRHGDRTQGKVLAAHIGRSLAFQHCPVLLTQLPQSLEKPVPELRPRSVILWRWGLFAKNFCKNETPGVCQSLEITSQEKDTVNRESPQK